MDPFLYASISDRDPPNFHEVQGLAKVYVNSRELFKSEVISVDEIPDLLHVGVRLNQDTILLCTKLPVLRYFPQKILEAQMTNSGPFNYLILDVTGIDVNLNSIEFLLKTLPSEKKVGVFKDWRKALLKAMLYASKKHTQHPEPRDSENPTN